MNMPFDRPTLREINSRIQADLIAELAAIGESLLRHSVVKVQGTVYAGVAHGEYGAIQNAKDQLFILTADEEHLEKHGAEYGIPRDKGSKATGSAIAIGTTGLTIDAGKRLQSLTGNIYIIDSSVTLTAGTALISFTAENVGIDYNEDAGTILSFISPIAGINSTVTVDANAITGGGDVKEVEAYRLQLLNRKRTAPHGGALFDYINWALEYSGVTRAWAIEHYQGVGTIGLAFVRDNDSVILPSQAQLDAVKAYIIYHNDPNTNLETGMPVNTAGLYMIPLTYKTVNVTIKLQPNTTVVQQNIRSTLLDLFKTYGGPEQNIALSQMNEAISSAIGEIRHKIITPTDDEVAAVNQVHVLGDITFQDY
jgi:uncharacterized phage protein gp47/JayE